MSLIIKFQLCPAWQWNLCVDIERTKLIQQILQKESVLTFVMTILTWGIDNIFRADWTFDTKELSSEISLSCIGFGAK